MTNIRVEKDADGIVTLTWDMPGRSMNVLSEDSINEYVAAADAGHRRPFRKGRGGDLGQAGVRRWRRSVDAAEADGCCLQGRCFAGAARQGRVRQPDAVQPGHAPHREGRQAVRGGDQRPGAGRRAGGLPRLPLPRGGERSAHPAGPGGVQGRPDARRRRHPAHAAPDGRHGSPADDARGQDHRPRRRAQGRAGAQGRPGRRPRSSEAKAYIKAGGKAVQPWDEKGFRVPGGDPYSTAGGQVFVAGNAMLHAKTMGNYPAPEAIMSAVYEGLLVPIDAGLRIEARYMTKVMMHPASRNMIRSLFINMQKANKLERRPKDAPPTKLDKIGVLGAGMMGAGIAYVSALAGPRGGADRPLAGGGREGQGLLGEAARQAGRARPHEAGRRRCGPGAHQARDQLRRPEGRRLRHRGGVRGSRHQGRRHQEDRSGAAGRSAVRLQHLDPADHRPGRGLARRDGVRRRALLLAGRQDAAGRDHPRQEDVGRHARGGHGLRQAHQEDADRRQRFSAASTPAACSRPTPARACACWPRASTRR